MSNVDALFRDGHYEGLRKKYRQERDRRIRPEGEGQYIPVTGRYARYVDHDPQAPADIERAPLTDEIKTLIIGGGWSGLLAAGRLMEQGVDDFRIIDDAADFGGAWYWNQYPGAQCDVDSYCYLPLLEETGYMPKRKYSDAPEIQDYARIIGEHYKLYDKAIFRTRVTEMRWDESSKRWIVKTNRHDELTAQFVVLAPGLTSRAKLPGIAGLDEFEGHAFHTSRWDYQYTGGSYYEPMSNLAGKKVGIIGTGCTAIQCIPHLAASAEHLYVFQRTPSAIDVRNNSDTDPEWYYSQEPGWQVRRRKNFDDLINNRPFTEDLVADGWTDIARKLKAGEYPFGVIRFGEDDPETIAKALELADFHKMDEIRGRVDQTVKDPEVAEKLKAWYAHLCKRPTFNDDYLDTFNRQNVTLVDTADNRGVERITKQGIVANGVEYPVDCLIFSTGFEQASSYELRFAVNVFGRDGQSLYEYWKGGMRTLHGHSAHGFPNWFFIGASQVGVTFNFVAVVDPVAQHVAYIISEADRRGIETVEATTAAEDEWVKTIHDNALDNLDFLESCTPGYYNSEGKIRESQSSFWGDWYFGGLFNFIDMLESWRTAGKLEGMAVEYKKEAQVPDRP
ncbi:flavin-containing monooxygenase [Sphingosinicella microcystinivorans]|uniref:flavin-containing monooxygenase n=1 Tax=Sphingosinicella microcystinivorans TaxID=335406 RepID=UPI0022F3DED3|nr:NAD(P)/FAD-dependent oxidoreductase [Sphingosinicella microcystinivorans]WBX83776.1 NAD(P)/FAD-dependent oxidoreductase [Sphingosinicella microcystinivorans]